MGKNIFLAIGAAIGLYVLVLFSQMVSHMDAMVGHVAQLSSDVSSMRQSMDKMQINIQHMDASMQKGTQQMQQANPINMMNKTVPNVSNMFRPR